MRMDSIRLKEEIISLYWGRKRKRMEPIGGGGKDKEAGVGRHQQSNGVACCTTALYQSNECAN